MLQKDTNGVISKAEYIRYSALKLVMQNGTENSRTNPIPQAALLAAFIKGDKAKAPPK